MNKWDELIKIKMYENTAMSAMPYQKCSYY